MDNDDSGPIIQFSLDAATTFEGVIYSLRGYVARIADADQPDAPEYDVEIIGPNGQADDVSVILVRRYSTEVEYSVGPSFSVAVRSLYIY